jgi:hypothetical protein
MREKNMKKKNEFINEFAALVKKYKLSELVLNEIANEDNPSECARPNDIEYYKKLYTRKKLEVVNDIKVLLDKLDVDVLIKFITDYHFEGSAKELITNYLKSYRS